MRATRYLTVLFTAAALTTACGGTDDTVQSSNDESVDSNDESVDSDEGRIELTVGTTPGHLYAPLFAGVRSGAWAEVGLDVTTVGLQGAGAALSALEGGSADIIAQNPGVAAGAIAAGAQIRMFCAGAGQLHSILAVEGSDAPVADGDDWTDAVLAMEGTAVGVAALGGSGEQWIKQLVASAGGDEGSVEFVAAGVGEQAINLLESGEVDYLFSFPFEEQIHAERTVVVFDGGQDGPAELRAQTTGVWVATAQWLDENSDTAESFCDTLGQIIREIQSGEAADVVDEVLEQDFQMNDPAVTERITAPDGPWNLLTNEISCESITPQLEMAGNAGQLGEEPWPTCDDVLWTGAAS